LSSLACAAELAANDSLGIGSGALQTQLETDDVAASITAAHFWVRTRGVMDSNSNTATASLGGVFKLNPETRREFLVGLDRS
jgi:GTP cyclohydrolase I